MLPDEVDFLIITTLIGGTVGGYITYAGAHRLVDSGITGPDHVREITRGSVTGILVTGVMRALLFLAVLGVVAGGVTLAADNPPASAFQAALGDVGVRVFGIILWAASITSVIGASYTSVSFLAGFSRRLEARRNLVTVGFIVFSAVVYLALGKAPVTLLVLAGALNGLILPVGFAVILWVAARRMDLLSGYRYPRWLLAIGALVWVLTVYLGWNSLGGIAAPAVTAVQRIDLNADLGEGFGAWTLGDDDALLEVITSANVACGFHAGDPTVLRRTCERAAERGVVIGAQVGYRDLAGFGRRFVDMDPDELTNDVLYQLGALEAFARVAGTQVRYVKPHGALYNAIVHHEAQAEAVVEAVRRYDPTLPVLGLPGSVWLAAAEGAGLTPVPEAFADRAYTPQGHAGVAARARRRAARPRSRWPSGPSGWPPARRWWPPTARSSR